MHASRIPSILTLCCLLAGSLMAGGCILDDAEGVDVGETGDTIEPGDSVDAFEQLAASCSYPALFAAAYKEAEASIEGVPPHRHLYTVSDTCLQRTENTLVSLGITFTFDGPIETDPVHRTVVEGLHYMLFSPLFAPPPVDGVTPVFGLDPQYPYPSLVSGLVPEVPPTYEWVIPHGYYNEALAQFFREAVTEIVDGTDSGASKTAKYEAGVITLLDHFAALHLGDPAAAAGTLVHEAAHSQGLGHKYCSVSEDECAGAISALDATCDCDYELSAYWIEAAFREAAVLGREVSFAPDANEPVDGTSSLTSHYDTGRCEYAAEHVRPFQDSDPSCESIYASLIVAIEAASDYWDDGL